MKVKVAEIMQIPYSLIDSKQDAMSVQSRRHRSTDPGLSDLTLLVFLVFKFQNKDTNGSTSISSRLRQLTPPPQIPPKKIDCKLHPFY